MGVTPGLKSSTWIGFTVSDLERSVAWYERVLGLERGARSTWGPNTALLRHAESGIQLGLIAHEDAVRFSEVNCGLDHLEFLVPDVEALDGWVVRLDEYGSAVRPSEMLLSWCRGRP